MLHSRALNFSTIFFTWTHFFNSLLCLGLQTSSFCLYLLSSTDAEKKRPYPPKKKKQNKKQTNKKTKNKKTKNKKQKTKIKRKQTNTKNQNKKQKQKEEKIVKTKICEI